MSIKTHKFVGLSYNPNDIKFGHVNNLQYFFERRRNQAILQGALRLQQLQTAYAKSLVETPAYTVLVFRDSLVSIALSLALRCLQTRDILYMELTNHASQYWAKFGNRFWVSIPNSDYVPDVGFCGVAGSLAFLLHQNQDTGNGLYPHQLLEKMLQYLWQALNIPSSLNPAEKVQRFLVNLKADRVPFDQYEQLLTHLASVNLTELSPQLQNFVLQHIRQKLLTPNDWSRLKLRWLLREFTPELVSTLVTLRDLVNQTVEIREQFKLSIFTQDLIELDNNILSVVPPAGTALMLVGLAVEALLKVIIAITQTQELHAVAYQDFLSQITYMDFRRSLALHLATAYDAFGALGCFNTIYEARGLAYRFFLAALQLIAGQQPIPIDGTNRLINLL